jgi:Arc/MetJ-type ribon-helix-helix transcriptional regulator
MTAREEVALSRALLDRVERRVAHTQFESAAEYVEFVVEEVLHEVEEGDDGDRVDEAEVLDRLESLGYLE